MLFDGSFSQYFWGKNAIFTTAPNTSVQVAPKGESFARLLNGKRDLERPFEAGEMLRK